MCHELTKIHAQCEYKSTHFHIPTHSHAVADKGVQDSGGENAADYAGMMGFKDIVEALA
jgi:hypothetical protein